MEKQLELSFDEIEKEVGKVVTKKSKPKSSKLSQKEHDLLEFKNVLNKVPPKKFLKTNEFYGNKYIPIEIIERMLSAIYESYQFVVRIPPVVEQGNIIFMIDVVLVNPITKQQEVFTGVSATPIMPKNGGITDIHPHIPAAKSFAIMNACKHIGRLFRGENDNITNIFNTYFEDKVKDVKEEKEDPAEARMKKMIDAAKNVEQLNKLKPKIKSEGMMSYLKAKHIELKPIV
jgi:hypothetical protein